MWLASISTYWNSWISLLWKGGSQNPPESPPYLHNYILLEKVPSKIDLISVYNYGVFVIGDCGIICDRLQENRAQRGTLRKIFFLHLQSCRRPDIELSKFYRRSLSRSHYNRPNHSLPSAWNNIFLRNRSIFSRYLRTPRCARFSCRRSHIMNCWITF